MAIADDLDPVAVTPADAAADADFARGGGGGRRGKGKGKGKGAKKAGTAKGGGPCGANAAGGGGFQPGNTCGGGGGSSPKTDADKKAAKNEYKKAWHAKKKAEKAGGAAPAAPAAPKPAEAAPKPKSKLDPDQKAAKLLEYKKAWHAKKKAEKAGGAAPKPAPDAFAAEKAAGEQKANAAALARVLAKKAKLAAAATKAEAKPAPAPAAASKPAPPMQSYASVNAPGVAAKPAPAPPLPPKPAAAGRLDKDGLPTHYDPTALTVVKQLGGTTGAELVKDAAGNLFVRKKGNSADHVAAEDRADQAYRALGLAVPNSRLYDTPSGPVKLAQFVKGTEIGKALAAATPAQAAAIKAEAGKGFAADVLLHNRDSVGASMDNMLVDANGKVWRIDNGGSLMFRAQGGKKDDLDAHVDYLWSMRSDKFPAGKVFGDVTIADIRDQIAAMPKDASKLGLNAAETAIAQQRLDKLKDVGATADTFLKDNWTGKYTDQFTQHRVMMDKAGILDKLPTTITRDANGHFHDQDGKPGAGLKNVGQKTTLDKDGKVVPVRTAVTEFADYVQGIGGKHKAIEAWMEGQGGSSSSGPSRAKQEFLAAHAGIDPGAIYGSAKPLKGGGYSAHLKAEMAKHGGEEAYTKAMIAHHAFTHAYLKKASLPGKDDAKGEMTIFRGMSDDAFSSAGLKPGDMQVDIPKKAAYESTMAFESGWHGNSMVQTVPIHRIVATYIQERTPGKGDSAFLGQSEKEFTTMLHGVKFDLAANAVASKNYATTKGLLNAPGTPQVLQPPPAGKTFSEILAGGSPGYTVTSSYTGASTGTATSSPAGTKAAAVKALGDAGLAATKSWTAASATSAAMKTPSKPTLAAVKAAFVAKDKADAYVALAEQATTKSVTPTSKATTAAILTSAKEMQAKASAHKDAIDASYQSSQAKVQAKADAAAAKKAPKAPATSGSGMSPAAAPATAAPGAAPYTITPAIQKAQAAHAKADADWKAAHAHYEDAKKVFSPEGVQAAKVKAQEKANDAYHAHERLSKLKAQAGAAANAPPPAPTPAPTPAPKPPLLGTQAHALAAKSQSQAAKAKTPAEADRAMATADKAYSEATIQLGKAKSFPEAMAGDKAIDAAAAAKKAAVAAKMQILGAALADPPAPAGFQAPKPTTAAGQAAQAQARAAAPPSNPVAAANTKAVAGVLSQGKTWIKPGTDPFSQAPTDTYTAVHYAVQKAGATPDQATQLAKEASVKVAKVIHAEYAQKGLTMEAAAARAAKVAVAELKKAQQFQKSA